MEFLLQKVLMVLTYLHRRAPGSVPHQLQSLAVACFSALRAADTCEVRMFVAKPPDPASLLDILMPLCACAH